MAVLRNCCCCIGLQRGTLILGILEIIASVFFLISSIISLIDPTEDIDPTENIDPTEDIDFQLLSQGDKDGVVNGNRAVHITNIIVFIILAATSGLMIFGTVKSRPVFLLPWLIWSIIDMVVTVIGIILLPTSVVLSPIVLITAVIYLSVIYFWLVVFSFFQELRDSERMKLNTSIEMSTEYGLIKK